MARRIMIDGKAYRMRRGELVEIPPEWLGQTTHPQTRQKRPSKALHKHRKAMKHGNRHRTTTGRGQDLQRSAEQGEGHG